MKNLTLFGFLLLLLSSCSVDVSGDQELDEAIKFTQVKECALGFEGPNCDRRQIDRFLGTYDRGLQWGTSLDSSAVEVHRLTESPLGNRYFQIEGYLYDEPIQAEVDGWEFSIPDQFNTLTNPKTGEAEEVQIYGRGWIDHPMNALIFQVFPCECQVELALN